MHEIRNTSKGHVLGRKEFREAVMKPTNSLNKLTTTKAFNAQKYDRFIISPPQLRARYWAALYIPVVLCNMTIAPSKKLFSVLIDPNRCPKTKDSTRSDETPT